MNAAQANAVVKAGDLVICRTRHGSKPIRVPVTSVTKAGWLRIEGFNTAFKPNYNGSSYSQTGCGGRGADCWPNDDRTWARLETEHNNHETMIAARKASQEAIAADRNNRLATELATVKQVLGGSLVTHTRCRETLPDGTRMVWISLPANPELSEHKKGYEILIARLVDENQYVGRDVEMQKVVRCYITYANGSTYSFSSCSGTVHLNDEEALWEACRRVYFSW